MPIAKRVTRREFIFTAGAGILGLLSGCGRSRYPFQPEVVLRDLRNNSVIQKIAKGEVALMHKEIEGMTQNGKEALAIVQRGLFSLGLVRGDPDDFSFGIYGPQTAKAVKYLQDWADNESSERRDGRRFGKMTLLALENALQEKIAGHWAPPSNF